ncbi:MAG: lipid droplet-associated protein [Mycobacterium sp.]
MATAPFGVRLLVGIAVTAIEETRRLPQTILMYPVTVASTFAQVVMKVQQDLAGLAIRGDEALEGLFPPKDEKPDWATFDEDLAGGDGQRPAGDGERRTEGRFALYSVADTARADAAGRSAPAKNAGPRKKTPKKQPPPIAVELDYESLTLAQLRARMPSLSITDLRALLDYEESAKARAPFQTLLANRITRATAK